ncbi:aminotransferase class IV [Pseudobdellovibrio exovorus]|uniref:Para-aminobenzoate synthase component I n=1 Tax=Pseudobdellovibrio exovorus JSS TaxID=1184267 RepID=M4VEC8_9BACT|nr:aminotransferase class IV [Pseudobdellovibrio exovorus]AGH96391.1 hypothetical protein A11Q_2175 [Pseudobdellovibrio exovorus JSS]
MSKVSSAFDILDTFKIERQKIALKEFHIERSWDALNFLNSAVASEKTKQLEHIYSEIEKQNPEGCYRLIFHTQGHPKQHLQYTLEPRELDPLPSTIRLYPWTDQRPPEALDQFKWSSRERWADLTRHLPDSADDLLLVTPTGHIKETSRFNVFCFSPAESCFYTPTLQVGCLNGVFRRAVLKNKVLPYPTYEKDLTLSSTSEMQIFVGNAVRGLIPAKIL